MDLDLLRTFLELNRTRHFGRAAEALFVTQAAVSSRLKSLEDQLGVTLFERSTREMRLTPEGGRLIRHSEKLIAAWRAARQDVSLAEASQQLVIGGSLRLWDVLLQRWLHDLRRNYPSLAIIAEAQTPDYLTRKLIDGTLDVAILLEPAQLDIMQIREVATVEFILVSSDHGLSVEQGQSLQHAQDHPGGHLWFDRYRNGRDVALHDLWQLPAAVPPGRQDNRSRGVLAPDIHGIRGFPDACQSRPRRGRQPSRQGQSLE